MKNTLYILITLIVLGVVGDFAYTNLSSKPLPPAEIPLGEISSNGESAKNVSPSGSNNPTNTPTNNPANTSPTQKTPELIGGNKDSHGCVLGGGYSWDAEMNACVRPWEKLSVLIPSKRWYLVNSDGSVSGNIFFETDTSGTKVSGKVCNSFSGTAKIDDKTSSVYISNVASTLMACTDERLSVAESMFFGIANGTVKVSLNENNSHITLSGSIAINGTATQGDSSATSLIKMEFAPKDR